MSHACHKLLSFPFTFLCSKDFLRITDGVSRIFGKYCGNRIAGKNLHLTGKGVELIFHSDGEIERRGYLLKFTLGKCMEHEEADKT